jgi:hypothetical protein
LPEPALAIAWLDLLAGEEDGVLFSHFVPSFTASPVTRTPFFSPILKSESVVWIQAAEAGKVKTKNKKLEMRNVTLDLFIYNCPQRKIKNI